jgi:hypothetical protein
MYKKLSLDLSASVKALVEVRPPTPNPKPKKVGTYNTKPKTDNKAKQSPKPHALSPMP